MSIINDECGCEQCGCHDEPGEDDLDMILGGECGEITADEASELGALFMQIRGLFHGCMSPEDKLDALSFVVADIMTDYEEGEDRDDLLTDFIDKVDADIEFLDDLMTQEDDEEEASNATEWVSDILDALPVSAALDVLIAVSEELIERAIASEAE